MDIHADLFRKKAFLKIQALYSPSLVFQIDV